MSASGVRCVRVKEKAAAAALFYEKVRLEAKTAFFFLGLYTQVENER